LDEIEDLAIAPLEVVVVLVDVGLFPKPLLFSADADSLTMNVSQSYSPNS